MLNFKKTLSFIIVSAAQAVTLAVFVIIARSYLALEANTVSGSADNVLLGGQRLSIIFGCTLLLVIIYTIEGIASAFILDFISGSGRGSGEYFMPIPFTVISCVFSVAFFLALLV